MAVAAVLKIVSALGFRELVEDAAAEFPELIDGPCGSITEQFLQLGECQFDRVQIRRVRRQVAQFGTDRFDGFTDTGHLVAREIVHHDDVARFQNGRQMLLDPGPEQRTVESSLNG